MTIINQLFSKASSNTTITATRETDQTHQPMHFSKNIPIKTNLFKKPNLVLNYFDRHFDHKLLGNVNHKTQQNTF